MTILLNFFWRKWVILPLVAFVARQTRDHYKRQYLRKFCIIMSIHVIVTCRTVRTIADIPIPKPYVLIVFSINDSQPCNIGIGMRLKLVVQTLVQTLIPGYWFNCPHVVSVLLHKHDEGSLNFVFKKVVFSQSPGPVYPQHEYYKEESAKNRNITMLLYVLIIVTTKLVTTKNSNIV